MVLDHSSHVSSLKCNASKIIASFDTQEAFEHVEKEWHFPQFNLITYHVGCGDEFHGQRSYFLAKNPSFDCDSKTVIVDSKPIDKNDAIQSGELSWGTYKDPLQSDPVKGHIRLSEPDPVYRNQKTLQQATAAK